MNETGPFDAVIAVVGHKAAGKDTLCHILEEHGFQTRRVSDAIRAEAKRRGVDDPPVTMLIELGNEGRAKGGPGFWAEELIRDFMRDGVRLAVVNGVRNPGEIASLRRAAGDRLILVGITARYDVRLSRFLRRGQAGDELTAEKFAELDAADRGKGQPDDGQQTDRCMAMVPPENVYDNSATLAELEEYEAWAENLLARHGVGAAGT